MKYDTWFNLKMTIELKQMIQKAADQDDRTLSNWARRALMAAAKEQLKK